ncbi:MAG: efflux transporter outer membrane subunit [Bacteroidales bacterium]
MKKIFAIILPIVFVSSCLVGPKYSRPQLDSLATWNETCDYVDTIDTIINLKWFELFKDTTLNKLIETALKENHDLKNAALRIEQARASYGIAKSYMLPSFDYNASASINSHTSENFEILGTASWEIDFWGKIRHLKRARYNELLASEEGIKTITTTLISDVASFYFRLRDLDHQLLIADSTVLTRTEYFNLVNERFKGGHVAELDKLQAEQQLYIAKATVQSIKRELNYTERSLNILLGQIPQQIARGMKNEDQTEMPDIPVGLPSDILYNRPDVKQAEFYLIAETEQIGVAQAMRFPSFSLTGFFGLGNSDISLLTSKESIIANASANILGPIFAWGRNKKRVDVQRKQAEIAANNYIKTYIAALGEVENSLISVQTYGLEFEARQKQAEAASKALMLSQERYKGGYTDYLEVLIAENAMFDSKLLASSTKAQQLIAYINLYRALGGGW